MTTFQLLTPGLENPPAFTSARTCRDWLAVQPLSNAPHAQGLMLRQLNLLNRYALPAAERLKILELMRDPINFVQTESARKFAGRPLPLGTSEQAGMDANRSLWQALQTGYLHCLEACLQGDGDIQPHAALVAQRAIGALRAELLDIYRAPMEPPPTLWQNLHRIYGAAERLGVADNPTSDTLQTKHPLGSVTTAYAQALLLHRASPYQLSARQLMQVWQWLQRWGKKVTVLSAAPLEPRVPPLIVDLASDQPETSLPHDGGDLRWLDLSGLSRSIKKRIVHLQRGESPASLGLGDDCQQPACGNLLKHLYQHWFKGGATRQHQRRVGNGVCRLVTGFDALHYYLSGKPFRQPGESVELTSQQHEEIATLGRVSTRQNEGFSVAQGYATEEWQMLDESPVGLRLSRSLGQAGARIGGGQLVAVQPDGTRSFLLAVARWSRIAGGRDLQTGVQILPGAPQAVAVRGTGLSAANEKYRHGFLLPPVASLTEPETVVVPAGWFRTGRVIELYTDSPRQVRLTRLLDRGSDFERAAYDAL